MIASSSAIRVDTDSAVLPISETAFCPWPGRQCGSQRAHSQTGLPAVVGEYPDLQVVGGVQGRRLGDEPAADGPRRVAGAGHAEHAALRQRHRDRGVRDIPEDLPQVLLERRVE